MTHPVSEPYRTETVAAPATHLVDWPAIFAGATLAVALSFVLLTFGSAIGLSVASFQPGEGPSLFWLGIASGLWFIWVAIMSFAAGGYLAGRLRRPVPGSSIDETETRDGAHGVLVWATAALVGAVLATTGVTGVIGAAGKVAGTAAETAAGAVGGDLDYLGGRLLQSGSAATSGAGGAEVRQDVTAILTRSLADGKLTPEDHDYLAAIVARQTGQTPEAAGAAIDATVTRIHEAYENATRRRRPGPPRRRHRRLRHRRHPDGRLRHRLLRRHHRRRPPRPQHALPHLRPLKPITFPPRNCPPPLGGGLFLSARRHFVGNLVAELSNNGPLRNSVLGHGAVMDVQVDRVSRA